MSNCSRPETGTPLIEARKNNEVADRRQGTSLPFLRAGLFSFCGAKKANSCHHNVAGRFASSRHRTVGAALRGRPYS